MNKDNMMTNVNLTQQCYKNSRKKETKMEAIFDISIKKLQDPNLKFHDNTLHIPFCKNNVPWVHIFNSSEST